MKIKLYISVFIFCIVHVCVGANCDTLNFEKVSYELRTFDQKNIDAYKNNATYNYIHIHNDELNFFEKLRNKFIAWLLDREVLDSEIPDYAIYLYYILAFAFGAILLFLIYKLGYINFFQKEDKEDDDILLEEIDKNTDEDTIDALIQNAKSNHEYRLATRLFYLKSLKKLSDNTLIDWRKGKTNADYVTELKSTNLKQEFQQLTSVFEYVWYGEFEVEDADAFTEIETKFEDFFTKIKAI